MPFNSIQPILAASLLPQVLKEHETKSRRNGCGIKEIDDALKGGLDPGGGGLTCISGEKGVGKTALAFAFLVTYLLSSKTNQAVLVDTTGTFDVLRLYNTILSRLQRHSGPSKTASLGDDQETAAAEILDRVKIMRIFDFVGLVEAVTEVREKLESQQRGQERREEASPKPAAVTTGPQPQRERSVRKLQRARSTIPDSDDEEEDDVMLFDIAGPVEELCQDEPMEDVQEVPSAKEDAGEKVHVGMIIVDNITHVVGPMMKNNYVQASALLTSFLRSLSQLAKSHDLSTILINAAMNVPSAPPSKNHPQSGRGQTKNPYKSIFASAGHLMPALSPLLPSHADLHLFITSQPLTRQDAVTQQSFSNLSSTQISGNKSNLVSVAELMSDRYADRVGRWAAFWVNDSGFIEGVDPQRGVPRKEYRLPGFASKVVI